MWPTILSSSIINIFFIGNLPRHEFSPRTAGDCSNNSESVQVLCRPSTPTPVRLTICLGVPAVPVRGGAERWRSSRRWRLRPLIYGRSVRHPAWHRFQPPLSALGVVRWFGSSRDQSVPAARRRRRLPGRSGARCQPEVLPPPAGRKVPLLFGPRPAGTGRFGSLRLALGATSCGL